MSRAAANGHLTAFKSFTRWLVQGEHVTDTAAMAAVQRVRPVTVTKKPHERRAMRIQELTRLLAATEAGPVRAGELRRLRRCDLHLADPVAATLTVTAGLSKNRKAATPPLKRELATELLGVVAGQTPSAAALAVPGRQHRSRVLAADLDDARAAWLAEAGDDATLRMERESSDLLAVRDHAGRVSTSTVSGTPSSPTSARPTINISAHAVGESLVAGVTALPALLPDAEEARLSATGTTDAEPARPASART